MCFLPQPLCYIVFNLRLLRWNIFKQRKKLIEHYFPKRQQLYFLLYFIKQWVALTKCFLPCQNIPNTQMYILKFRLLHWCHYNTWLKTLKKVLVFFRAKNRHIDLVSYTAAFKADRSQQIFWLQESGRLCKFLWFIAQWNENNS